MLSSSCHRPPRVSLFPLPNLLRVISLSVLRFEWSLLRYLGVPFGLLRERAFLERMWSGSFSARSPTSLSPVETSPTSLSGPAHTFFSLIDITVHRVTCLWCMEPGDKLFWFIFNFFANTKRTLFTRFALFLSGVLYVLLHTCQQGKNISLISTIRERNGVIRLEYMDTIFGPFVLF